MKPRTLYHLHDWHYLERSVHRLLAGWGRHFEGWTDKSACHRHVWDQAECVRRIRDRIAEFPGGKPDAPVSVQLEKLANAVLLAPGFEDALDGIYRIFTKALAAAYGHYTTCAHPVHDAPTLRLLHDIIAVKEQQWLWHRDHRRARPHGVDSEYEARISAALADCNQLLDPLPLTGTPARLCGVGIDFALPRISARPPYWKPKYDLTPYLRADFPHSVDARRLFWAYGYMREKNLPDDQLRWIWYGHAMPWEFHQDVSRHLWDESRHGDSGYSRLQDFGIPLEETGFTPYVDAETCRLPDGSYDFNLPDHPLSLRALYDEVFHIGMVAETGHFQVKNEAFADFREVDDLESAEMMIFDIIDETAHVQYAHRWLPVLAEMAGVDHADYRERALRIRREKQEAVLTLMKDDMHLERLSSNPAYALYEHCLHRVRAAAPVSRPLLAERSPLPM